MTLLGNYEHEPVRSEASLTDRVAEILVSEITSGRYQLGEVLPPERVIAERLGVSRTVLREAVSRLRAEGLLDSKQGRGLAVKATSRPSVLRIHAVEDDDLEQVISIVELRRGFEIEAASLAAARRTESDLEDMRSALNAMRRAVEEDDVAAGIEADRQFHYAIARATGNKHYVEFFEFLSGLLVKNLQESRTRSATAKRGTDAQQEHELLYQAIKSGSPEEARQLARTHIENTEARLLANSQFAGFLKNEI